MGQGLSYLDVMHPALYTVMSGLQMGAHARKYRIQARWWYMNIVNKEQVRQTHRVRLPLQEPLGRISCPRCGNYTHFVEQAESVMVTTAYMQNTDGSFTPMEQSYDTEGDLSFLCGECGNDLTPFHAHFREMVF